MIGIWKRRTDIEQFFAQTRTSMHEGRVIITTLIHARGEARSGCIILVQHLESRLNLTKRP
jgi:hypothetical protein